MTTNNPKNTDQELVELAAKAVGYSIWQWERDGSALIADPIMQWRPLEDDGDALRLAIKLGVDLRLPISPNQVFVQVGERGAVPFVLERIDGNPLSATRRAIVRAAAEVGRDKP